MPVSLYDQIITNLDKIVALYFQHTGGSAQTGQIKVTELGGAENNINFLVTLHTNRKFVIRVVRTEENRHRLENEFEILQLLPAEIGPVAIGLDTGRSILTHSFMLETYIPGEKVDHWDIPALKSLAWIMARYHSVKSDYFGTGVNRSDRFDISGFFNTVSRPYLDSYPSIRKDPEVAFVLDKLNSFFRSHRHLFDNLHNFPLIHGDLTKQNILRENNRLNIIDWEVSSFGDNANDFVTFFYDDFEYHNWRVRLDPHHRKVFVDEYLKYFDDETLKDRINVWMVFDKACSLIFCKMRLESYRHRNHFKTLTEEQFGSEINKLYSSLKNFFQSNPA